MIFLQLSATDKHLYTMKFSYLVVHWSFR